MGLCHIVLVIGITLLFGVDTLSTGVLAEVVSKSPHLTDSIVSGSNIIGERSQRVEKRDEAGEGVNGSYEEERAGGFVSKLSSFFGMSPNTERQVVRWADADKSDDFVKEKLKLNGLSGDALKSNKNYIFFENFVKMKETNRVNTWIEKQVPTYDVWKKLGLGKVRTMDDLLEVEATDAYRIYTRYADAFDNRALVNFVANKEPVPVISSDASWVEKISRTANWIRTKKPDEYVKMALGLDKLPSAARKTSKNYEFYMLFMLVKNQYELEDALKKIEFYLKRAQGLVKLPPEALAKSNKYKAYIFFLDLSKNNKSS